MRVPKWSGQRGLTLTELLVALAIVSLLVTVMAPRVTQHMERARSTEAVLNLGMMAQGAQAYYLAEHTDTHGGWLARRFPAGQEFTPEPNRCIGRSQGLCPGSQWLAPTWMALSFSLPGDTYYAYGFQSTGVGEGARAAAIALRGGVPADRAVGAPELICLYVYASGQKFYGPCGGIPAAP